MNGFQLIVASLACYRLTVLISRDAGPWRIFARLRNADRFSKLLKCPYCVSLWCAVIIVTAFYACQGWQLGADNAVMPVLLVLALSAASIALDRLFTSDHLAQ